MLFCLKGPNEIPHGQNVIITSCGFGTMVGKVAVTQTQARRTWWDPNKSAWVDDAMTFLEIMTKQMAAAEVQSIATKPSTSLF